MRRLVLSLLIAAAFTGCSTQRSRCVDEGKVALLADPTDDQTQMIACVEVGSVDDVYDHYTITVSDD